MPVILGILVWDGGFLRGPRLRVLIPRRANSEQDLGAARRGDQIVDFVRRWSEASEIGAGRLVGWLGVAASKFYDWLQRCGHCQANGSRRQSTDEIPVSPPPVSCGDHQPRRLAVS
jgi:hypothetical protein